MSKITRFLETKDALHECANDHSLPQGSGPSMDLYRDWWQEQFLNEKDYPNLHQIKDWFDDWIYALHDAGFTHLDNIDIQPIYETLESARTQREYEKALEDARKELARQKQENEELAQKIARGELKSYSVSYSATLYGQETVYAKDPDEAVQMVNDMYSEGEILEDLDHEYYVKHFEIRSNDVFEDK